MVNPISDSNNQQTVIEVTTEVDEIGGVGVSLRQAIAEAATTVPPKTITFNSGLSGKRIVLTNGPLVIDKTLTIDGSGLAGGITIDGNNASRVFQITSVGNATLNTLTITGGNASEESGGAFDNQGKLTLLNSTISGNSAGEIDKGKGGGIVNTGTLVVTNSTISGNTAGWLGGAIAIDEGTVTLRHSTLSGNRSDGGGGGIYHSGTDLTLENTIVAGNTAEESADIYLSGSPSIKTEGGNLIGSNEGVSDQIAAGTANAGGDYVGTPANPLDPQLAPLDDYGGPTQTMRLLPGSPAIDAGVALAGSPATDQRGMSRGIGGDGTGGIDIGAFERVANPVAGLWVGEVIVDAVTSIVDEVGSPPRSSAGSAPIRILLHSDHSGAVRLLSQVTIMQTKTVDPVPVLVVDPVRIPSFEGIKERNGKRVGLRLEAVAFDMPRKLDVASQEALAAKAAAQVPPVTLEHEVDVLNYLVGSSKRPAKLDEDYHLTLALEGALGAGKTVRTSAQAPLTLDPFHRSNPFRHAFHQSHPKGPKITRELTIVFDPNQAIADRLRGSYREAIQGLTKSKLKLTGSVELRRVSTIDTLDGATPDVAP